MYCFSNTIFSASLNKRERRRQLTFPAIPSSFAFVYFLIDTEGVQSGFIGANTRTPTSG